VIVYLVRDKATGLILKVGDTTVGGAIGRWTLHLSKARAQGRQIVIDYVTFRSAGGRKGIEDSLRRLMESQGHQMLWDKEGKRDPSKFIEAPFRRFPSDQ
jgi:hypothetical protein